MRAISFWLLPRCTKILTKKLKLTPINADQRDDSVIISDPEIDPADIQPRHCFVLEMACVIYDSMRLMNVVKKGETRTSGLIHTLLV